jgi:hypothetical protein
VNSSRIAQLRRDFFSNHVQTDEAPTENRVSSLHALLERSIDYAGLFPPATLNLEPALKNQARYVLSDQAWMLSTFVLPVTKFADAAWFVSDFDEKHPLRISALGPKTINAIDFLEELKIAAKGIREFGEEAGNRVQIHQLEMPLPGETKAETLRVAREIIGDLELRVFWETSLSAAPKTIALLAVHNAGRKALPFGFKLRTGGVTADAFPASREIARALVASAESNIPIKFTAGLHHPIRMFRDEVNGKMHGFLNVLGAGVLGREHGWDEERTAAMLEDEDASSFAFDDWSFRWHEWHIDSANIKKHRQLVTSFGSCSFDEPREDLRALGFLR